MPSRRNLLSNLRWVCTLAGVIGAVSVTHAADRSPEDILKQSLAFLSAQNRISVRYSSDIEVVTPALEKVQFSGSGTLGMERPDKFRISRVGGFADVELISDGTSFTIHDRGEKRFAPDPRYRISRSGFEVSSTLICPEPICYRRKAMRRWWRE